MGLKLPKPPAETQAIVAGAMQRANSFGRLSVMGGATGGAAVVTPVAPHEVYDIGLKELVDGEGLKAAKPVGWRVLVLQGNTPVAAVEYSAAGGGAPASFKSANEGVFVRGTVLGISMAEGLPQLKNEDYELRLLQIPSIYLIALWLQSKDENLFVPLDPAPGRFKALNSYSEAAFFELAAELAKGRIGVDDRPKRKPPSP
jgi:hypothetical protein